MASYDRLPLPLSERLSSATANIYSRQGREVDVSIGGIPFRLATFTEAPQSVETIPIRKDQFDSENDPGEQSLTGWWRRSQASWHEGAGNLYQENSERVVDGASFYQSSGIDVFTPGRISLLKKMVQNTSAPVGSGRIRTYAANGVRTNLCENPSFETDLTGWAGSGGVGEAPTLTRDTTKFYSGTASLKAVWGASDGSSASLIGINGPAASVASGVRFTISARVWVPTGSPAIQFVSNFGFGSVNTVFDEWTTITISGTTVSSGPLQIAIWPSTQPDAGDLCYVDAVIAEESNIVGPFFDGNSPNAAWSGTAELSTSVETITATSTSVSLVAGGDLYTAPTVGGSYTVLHNPASSLVDALISGPNFYSVASDGTLYEGLVSSPGTATEWPCGTTPTRLGWGKHRLWVIGGRKLWQPDLSLAGGTAQNPIFTHPNAGWSYTCLAEGSSAMLFGGHDGFNSTIQSITLDTGGGLPTLSGAAVTAALPDGELVQELAVLAGQYVGIGTNRGFRVGTMAESGQITYGPLIIEPDDVTACTALCAQGQFFVVAFRTTDGSSVAYRVDTSTELTPLVFPYAADIDCGNVGAITSLASASNSRLICTTSNGAAWNQSDTDYVDEGWIQTGRIRYRTTEFKQFKTIGLEIEPLAGAISIELIKEGGSTLSIGSITRQGETFSDKFSIEAEKMRHASVKLMLTPTDDSLDTPVVSSYQLRAIPAVAPQRLITLPLLCFDKEQARSGQQYGGSNFASDRLTALQLLEDQAETVLYQDFTSVTGGGITVTIESVKFIASSPAPPHKAGGAGGILVLQLRTAEA